MWFRLWLAAVLAAMVGLAGSSIASETPKRGGTLTYLIPADAPPSFDGHREATYATVHAAAPFYSVLIRVNPNNPASPTDLCATYAPKCRSRATAAEPTCSKFARVSNGMTARR